VVIGTAPQAPLIVHAHGYNDRFQVMHEWARRGFNVCGFDARGFGRSAEAVAIAPEGYVLTGIASPDTQHIARRGRGLSADAARGPRTAGRARCPTSVNFYGFSFGGALALMASALSRDPDFVVAGTADFRMA
jgi:cephalosporin-C deacetylase-like acetyl esterase